MHRGDGAIFPGLRYAHVLLDFDRTLNDSDLVHQRKLDGFLGLTGHQVLQVWEKVHRYIVSNEPWERHEDLDFHYRMMLEQLARTDADTIKTELRSRIKAAQEECWHATALFEETLPFLNALKDAGYVLHIATGDYAKLKADGIERQGGRDYFTYTYDEETLGVGKGGRDYFDRIVKRLAARRKTIVIVGDSIKNDIEPGKKAGLKTVWVRRNSERNEDGVKPDLTVALLTESLVHFGV